MRDYSASLCMCRSRTALRARGPAHQLAVPVSMRIIISLISVVRGTLPLGNSSTLRRGFLHFSGFHFYGVKPQITTSELCMTIIAV